ncbi:hypothetical protein I310_02189 [Cryptococcus deuterogattii CA1014]|nr:hypothetical protein I310_02189 [Cryptococcus deuterogattii CA1014]KIR99729.1 hypothetical protein L804_03362 [Cryptococcus deuterogattii 2001/935-1]
MSAKDQYGGGYPQQGGYGGPPQQGGYYPPPPQVPIVPTAWSHGWESVEFQSGMWRSACKGISFVFTWDFQELGDDDGDEEVWRASEPVLPSSRSTSSLRRRFNIRGQTATSPKGVFEILEKGLVGDEEVGKRV